jgi:hypothetical protein
LLNKYLATKTMLNSRDLLGCDETLEESQVKCMARADGAKLQSDAPGGKIQRNCEIWEMAEDENPKMGGGQRFTVQWEVLLEGTVWDALLIVGMGEADGFLLSAFQTAVVVFLGVVNFVVQCVCIWGIRFMYHETNPLNPNVLTSILNQRIAEYHDVGGMDHSLLQSKARRLCSEGVYNQMAVLSSDVHEFLLPEGPIFGWTAGGIVSSIAMFVWIMTMTAELQRVYLLQMSVIQLKSSDSDEGGVREHAVLNDSGDGFDIVALSHRHKIAFTLLIQLPRLLIALSLLLFGLLWLAETVAVDELILNACALEMVYKIDEGLFSSVLVNLVRVDHFRLESRRSIHGPREHARWLRGLVEFGIPIGFILVLLSSARLSFIGGFTDDVRTAQHYMCGEDLDFVFGFHGVSRMPFFANLPRLGGESRLMTNTQLPEHLEDGQFRCVYAASRDLIAVRAGFPALYLSTSMDPGIIDLMLGNHSSCVDDNPLSRARCSTRRLDELYRVRTIDDWELENQYCHDQPLHIAALSQVCTHQEFFDPSFSPFFENRRTCSDFQELCECKTFTYSKGYRDCSDAGVTGGNLSRDWTMMIRHVCPETCKACDDYNATGS